MSNSGSLYVVATPIGHLDDMGVRAVKTLQNADLILAEDTRNSKKLLDHYNIRTTLKAFHEHNERQKTSAVLQLLADGQQIALISDAGTPLISDPGYVLVNEALKAGYRVVPIPGASAITALLSVCGLPTDRFCFEGFLSAKGSQRKTQLRQLRAETRTMVFYESPHRIASSLSDMVEAFGEARLACYGRELTKQFETIRQGELGELLHAVQTEAYQQKGEFVVAIAGASADVGGDYAVDELLQVLLSECSVKQASKLAAALGAGSKRELYARALELQQDEKPE